jgi:hypothetical protein
MTSWRDSSAAVRACQHPKGHRLLPSTCGMDRLLGLRPDRELAGSRVCRGARPASRTLATGDSVKPDADDRIARHIVSGPPVDTGISLESVRLLSAPIQDKGLQVMPLFSLQSNVDSYRSQRGPTEST